MLFLNRQNDSLCSKMIGGLMLFMSIAVLALTPADTPLFDSQLSARGLGLGKAGMVSNYDLGFMMQNPATISNQQGIMFQGSQYLGLDYTSLTFANQYQQLSFGVNYLGSSLTSIVRSVMNGNRIELVPSVVPYEYHSVALAFSMRILTIDWGIGAQYQFLMLDNVSKYRLSQFMGIIMAPIPQLRLGASIQNYSHVKQTVNALLKEHPIYTIGGTLAISPYTSAHFSFISNKNEVNTHATFHYAIEQYVHPKVPVRLGLDHNRYTVGIGWHLDPFKVAVGWAQSRHPIADDQWVVSFSYDLNDYRTRYRPL